ncbi:hypothetical protein [Sediminitomix flava]|uniref:Uncharacterized protein n=1 Tax=Sediminitomix flava TaxID=379075 RepID=A0A315ZCK3_SEDFL|nr:hypothetical protein [Sediminitomix flava]PWJ43315.1 hypothetical protein BC781_102864 [Sediminitomix flava]
MATIAFNSVFNSSNFADFVESSSEAQDFMDGLRKAYFNANSNLQRNQITQEETLLSRSELKKSIAKKEAQVTALEALMDVTTDPEELADLSLEKDDASVKLRKDENAYENRYQFPFIKKGFEIELYKAEAEDLYSVIQDFLGFVDSQTWTIEEYGLRS